MLFAKLPALLTGRVEIEESCFEDLLHNLHWSAATECVAQQVAPLFSIERLSNSYSRTRNGDDVLRFLRTEMLAVSRGKGVRYIVEDADQARFSARLMVQCDDKRQQLIR